MQLDASQRMRSHSLAIACLLACASAPTCATAQEHAPARSQDEMHEMPMDMDTAASMPGMQHHGDVTREEQITEAG